MKFIALIFLSLFILGCDPIQNAKYASDEWDAIVYLIDNSTVVVKRVESPAKIKNDLVIIYDKWNNFDARMMIPKNELLRIEFIKP